MFQPGGQLITLITDGLPLPFLAFLGFVDVLALMFFLVWLANKHFNRLSEKSPVEAGKPARPDLNAV